MRFRIPRHVRRLLIMLTMLSRRVRIKAMSNKMKGPFTMTRMFAILMLFLSAIPTLAVDARRQFDD
jgi:hypothetical protein